MLEVSEGKACKLLSKGHILVKKVQIYILKPYTGNYAVIYTCVSMLLASLLLAKTLLNTH